MDVLLDRHGTITEIDKVTHIHTQMQLTPDLHQMCVCLVRLGFISTLFTPGCVK